ncbi:MAG: M20/M25/M40 family metallo-hydrolase [Deinococcus-Thermus bacterium]|jgi:putative selenium metabolism hydrolase|nr:M20/M25/M40 family metallo-hydrolase [Deinococcota bacterium]
METSSPTIDLARDLVRAPSPSGAESPATEVLLAAFERLGFDRARIDEAGNAIGAFERGDGPTVMFNGHLDTVPLGDEALWPHPPLSGAISDGRLWGRGASDMKGSLACMAVAAARAVDEGFRGTLLVTGVVQEEVGGLGARWLGETTEPDVIVLGEPSKLGFKLGHRGRVEVDVSLPGRIAHAAKAELGDNALYRAARFLAKLENLSLPSGGPLGRSTATPTRLISRPADGANVVPGEAVVTVDYRNLPNDPPDEVLARLQALDPAATLTITDEHAVSENGAVERTFPRVAPAYLAPGENRWTDRAREALRTVLPRHGVTFDEGTWWFATDAPHLATSGAVVVGFGPGEEELAHTTRESVRLDALEIATDAYRELALRLSGGVS